MRTLAASLLALGLLASGCSTPERNPPASAVGGSGGSGPGGSGGSDTGGSGGLATGGSGGAVVTGGSGGADAAGGSIDSAAGVEDAAVSEPDAPAADASTTADSGGGDLGGMLATHPWVIPCDANATRAECCMHYCTCMMMNCPSTAPANCVATCTAPGNTWNLKCRVEQCYEALDPKYPMDKASHCGHAVEKPPKCQGIIP